MPAKDRYHDVVVRALQKDGWRIASEQVKLGVGGRALFIDIEAEQSSEGLIILVEVKELEDVPSQVEALAHALGKYDLYRLALAHEQIDIALYLAVTLAAYQGILSESVGAMVMQGANILMIVFDPETEEIVKWIP